MACQILKWFFVTQNSHGFSISVMIFSNSNSKGLSNAEIFLKIRILRFLSNTFFLTQSSHGFSNIEVFFLTQNSHVLSNTEMFLLVRILL